MPAVSSNDPLLCVPFNVGEGPSDIGPRLGGQPPAGVAPISNDRSCRYFLTVPLIGEPAHDVSVFVRDDARALVTVSSSLQPEGLIEVIVHQPAARSVSSAYASTLSEHPLVLSAPQADWLRSDDGECIVASFHKLGGRPYFVQRHDTLERAVDRALAHGYDHVLQIDFPALPGDVAQVAGDWPFGDGLFHLLGRPPLNRGDWLWFWQH